MPTPAQIASFVGHAQERSWSCGPGALVNALAVLGHDVSEDEVRALADTDSVDGTDEHGLIEAIEELGHDPHVIWTSDRPGAWSRLVDHVGRGHPVLLCVDEWDHWVAITATDGKTVTMIDPADEEPHEVSLGQQELLRRWKHPDEDRPFYAIVVEP